MLYVLRKIDVCINKFVSKNQDVWMQNILISILSYNNFIN
jgi:hypothetical protein